MKTFAKWLSGIVLVLLIGYFLGPKSSKPEFEKPVINLPSSLAELEKLVNDSEKAVKGIRPDNEARIIWADSSKKEKTKITFLYLHGFSASQAEGDPVHRDIAKKYNANLYLTRLEEHGIERGDSNMISLTADGYAASAEKALMAAQQLGDEVVIIGTSAGGVLTLFLASRHPEIKAIVLYSPCVKLYDKTASVPAMLEMFDELGTPDTLKRKMAFPETGAHVIASYIRSKDWQGVERETDRFLKEIVKL